jgi:APA family basic amino acid/polyamine antiporter
MGFLNVTLMQIPRAYYAMAKDKTLPPIFHRVNNKTQVQEFTLSFFVATILLSILFLGTFEKVVSYVMFIDSLNIALVASTIFILRHRSRSVGDSYKGYRVPLYPVVPALFVTVLVCISVNVLLTETMSALIGILIFLSGFPIFVLMRRIYQKKGGESG